MPRDPATARTQPEVSTVGPLRALTTTPPGVAHTPVSFSPYGSRPIGTRTPKAPLIASPTDGDGPRADAQQPVV